MKIGLKSKGKSIGIILLLSSFLFSLLFPSLMPGSGLVVSQQSAQAAPSGVEARIRNLRGKGDRFIQVRVRVLNTAINRLKKAKRISDEDRNSLIADLQSNIDELSSLKGKIDAEIDVDTLRSQVRSIFVDYRIFMVVLPRDRGLFAVARLTSVISKLENVSSQLESLINTYKEDGKDTSEVEGYLSTLKSDLDNAKSDIDQAKSTFSAMTPEKDDEAHSMVKKGIEFLKAASSDLRDAAKQARKIISWLKNVK